MYEGIGVYWIMTLLGCYAALLALALLLFKLRRKKVREKREYSK